MCLGVPHASTVCNKNCNYNSDPVFHTELAALYLYFVCKRDIIIVSIACKELNVYTPLPKLRQAASVASVCIRCAV